MYKFKKILVGLDQSEMDIQLIKAVCKICQISQSTDIYFINLIKDFQVPDSVLKEFPDILDKALAERKAHIKKNVKTNFFCEGVKPHFLVKKGQPTKEMINFADKKDIDLMVIGRKNEKKGGGILINRLARRAGTSLLVIPKDKVFKTNRILVPIDFSSYAKLSLEKAVEIAKYDPEKTKVITQNVYQVPSGYHYTGKSFEEFADIMMENAHKDFEKFTKNVDYKGLDIDSVYSLDKDEDIIRHIYNTAKSTKSNLILIGAKGRSATTALFIGSKAEKLIQMDTEIPILVTRPKGRGAGLREYLKEI